MFSLHMTYVIILFIKVLGHYDYQKINGLWNI